MPIEFILKTTKETPPGSFRVTIPQSGLTITHYDWTAFTNAYRDHHIANGFPLTEDWREELQDRLCRENMPLWQDFCKRVGKRVGRKGLSFGAIMSGLNVMKSIVGRILKGEAAWVPQEEAERRAAICVTCDLNSKRITFGCGSCSSGFLKLLKLVIGNKTTTQDNSLGSCGVCSCALKVAVHVPLDLQWDALDEPTKEKFRDPSLSYCWKRME